MMRSPVRIVLALVLLSFAQNRNAQEEQVPDNPEAERPYTPPPVIFEKTLRTEADPQVGQPSVQIPAAPQREKPNEVPLVQVPLKTEIPENLAIPVTGNGDSPLKPVPAVESEVVSKPAEGGTQDDGQSAGDASNGEQPVTGTDESGSPYLPAFLVPPTESAPGAEDSDRVADAHAQGQPEPGTGDESHDQTGKETQGSSEEDEGLPLSEEESKPAEDSGTESDNSSTESINKSEDSIPSFSEWTQLQLSQRKESIINNIKNKTSLQEGKNFASPDCGAKVINSNPEAQNPSGVISSSHDEYMLNRCTVNTWFILELCEPLKIEQVSIGNLELFSSNPNEFELGISDRYPTRDWTILGPYFAPDARSMHSFPLPTNTTFGKFLRILVKSHHGNEHYCPLSVLKVHGKSEYEVLESETTHAEDEESNSNSIFEEEVNDDKPVRKSVLGTATDAVMDIVKKAANALVNNGNDILKSDQDTSKESPPAVPANNNSSCISLKQCIRDSEYKDIIISNLSCNSSMLNWLSSVAPWCGWEYCHSLLNKSSIGSPWMPEGLFVALYGPSIIETLCNYNKPIQSCDVKENKSLVQLTSGQPNDTSTAGSPNQNGPPGVVPVPPPTPVNPVDLSADPPVSSATPAVLSPLIPPQQPQPPQPSEPVNMPIEEPAQKESVFVRLSNRIKNLERNQSLSSGYLEELSRRFKKQNEDLNTAHESFRRTLNESMTKCKRVEDNLRYEVRKLNRNIDNLRELIWRVEMQRGGLVLFSLLQFFFTVFCWWTRDRKNGGQSQAITVVTTQGQSQGQSQSSEVLLSQRKRNNSETLKSVKKKKKRKEAVALAQALAKAKAENQDPTPFQAAANHIPKPQSPTTPFTSSQPFEFKSPNIVNRPTSSPTQSGNSNSTIPQFQANSGVLKPGISLSSVSDLSVSEDSTTAASTTSTSSHKKKSKFKSFFLGSK